MGKRPAKASDLIWAYCRVSTLKGEQELSLDEQVRWAEEFARDRGARLQIFKERASAKTVIGRPVCSRMLNSIEQGDVDCPSMLIATSFDRLSRDMTDTLMLARCIRSAGVALYIRDRGEIPMESFADQAALVGQAMGGHAENEARSRRCKASWARRRRECKPTSNKTPYGIQLIGERDVPIEDSAPWVLRAFQWYAQGIGATTILQRFKEAAPPHRAMTSRVGGDGKPILRIRQPIWEEGRVVKMLRQRRYRGVIVPEDLFDRVQSMLADRPHRQNTRVHEYPFAGAIKCETCGRSFHGHATGGNATRKRLADGSIREYPRRKRTRYYSCVVCRYFLRAEAVEETVLQQIDALVLSPKTIQTWIAAGGQLDDKPTTKEVERLQKLLQGSTFEKRRQRVWQLAVDNDIPGHELSRELEAIAAEEASTKNRCAQLKSLLQTRKEASRDATRAHDLLAHFRSLYDAASYEQKRELAYATISALGGATACIDGIRFSKDPRRIIPFVKIPDLRSGNGRKRWEQYERSETVSKKRTPRNDK